MGSEEQLERREIRTAMWINRFIVPLYRVCSSRREPSFNKCENNLRFPIRLPVWFRVCCHLAQACSVRAHDKYISLIVISQRVEGDPLTIRRERRSGIVAAIGELRGSLCLHIDAEDVLIALRTGIDQQILSIGRPIEATTDSRQSVC